jgi:two-component system, NarL family, invasion response regulator UvrY
MQHSPSVSPSATSMTHVKSMSRKTQILVVDDHAVVRAGLKMLLSDQSDMAVAGEAATITEARALVGEHPYDVLVLDLSLSGESGWELLKLAKRTQPKIAVLILSAFREDQFALQALKCGADGFLNKESAPELLIAAIRRIAAGGKYVSASLAERFARHLGGEENPAPHETLSEKEFIILKHIARGKSLVAIADELHISPKTVTSHRARILQKLGLENNADLTRFALEKGLLD